MIYERRMKIYSQRKMNDIHCRSADYSFSASYKSSRLFKAFQYLRCYNFPTGENRKEAARPF